MKTDRELLELAAKAAGIKVATAHEHGLYLASAKWWNPLTDDGDALRLAVKLQIAALWFDVSTGRPEVVCGNQKNAPGVAVEPLGTDHCAATRRAIVRAAAAIGEAMP